jgi:hypothetical protein
LLQKSLIKAGNIHGYVEINRMSGVIKKTFSLTSEVFLLLPTGHFVVFLRLNMLTEVNGIKKIPTQYIYCLVARWAVYWVSPSLCNHHKLNCTYGVVLLIGCKATVSQCLLLLIEDVIASQIYTWSLRNCPYIY